MREVSLLRLYVLRATYLLIAVGLGSVIWPLILNPPGNPGHMQGVARALLGAVSLLALLGIRYPLQMLPLLLFEITWKTIWVVAIGLPLWSAGALDVDTQGTLVDCLVGLVLFPLVIPWGYVVTNYVRRRGDRWGRDEVSAIGSHEADVTSAAG
jgi:hypothetical protein